MRRVLLLLLALSLAPGCRIVRHETHRVPVPHAPVPIPEPKPKPRKPWGPHCPCAPVGAPHEGGPIGPDGREVMADILTELRVKNTGGRDGAGLCVFTSIMHSARLQNERGLWNLQDDMRKEPGGGYPEKVDRMMEKYGKGVEYIQYEGDNPAILEMALSTGRSPGVTYNGHDCHYSGTIAHMVNLVYLDAEAACIMDNNFIGEDQLVWMTRSEFLQRWKGGGNGWAVVLLSPRPPAPPHN